jgi:hypothetical protein
MIGSLSSRIREFHHGKTYAKTKAKRGATTANKQAVAAAIHSMKSGGRTIGEIYRSTHPRKK